MISEKDLVVVPTQYVGGGACPFRGYPFRFPLDSRCPIDVEAITTEAQKTDTYAQISIPILRSESYCQSCTKDGVREKEEGYNVRDGRVSATRRRRRRR